MRVQNRERGFSLTEMLVVVAIIGTLSLVMVPAFINYQRSMQLKNTMRQFTTDLRSARQRAVTQTSFVRVTIIDADPDTNQRAYLIEESTNRGTSWTTLPRGEKEIDKIGWFTSTPTFTFLPNGTVQLPLGESDRTVRIDSQNRYGKQNYDVTVGLSGKVSVQ